MNKIYLVLILSNLISCGYPDIDSVPKFKNISLTDEQINDFCTNTNDFKKDIDKCINDYNSDN
tara:strand:- start:1030 stop:1218 length:189 start_codon:yes stop_codon:yes gene_type:complete